jgi:hypothetical protein
MTHESRSDQSQDIPRMRSYQTRHATISTSIFSSPTVPTCLDTRTSETFDLSSLLYSYCRIPHSVCKYPNASHTLCASSLHIEMVARLLRSSFGVRNKKSTRATLIHVRCARSVSASKRVFSWRWAATMRSTSTRPFTKHKGGPCCYEYSFITKRTPLFP